ncbi:MAG: hypothetical protein Q9M20_03860 [Mariprofundaceae bacterium]|nr:hypothetical protein [Mariprofundaceae bacterium]
MIQSKIIILSLIIGLSSCTQMTDTSTPEAVVNQLTGTWKSNDGKVIFYSDETAKMVFPQHTPPIKLISAYETVRKNKIGINLGGFWSGPALVDTSKMSALQLTITFPEESAIELIKEP